ncbi:serine acetyltransferase [Massilia endophytica]|uniref:serine acetyltransferase n=1 Tax=Massilia endophytica TaxID=2899220 RepID=UPI001E61746A|nr:serine acetyltransferase [Massilia endophytica]UGQ45728.1 serine acetyltransferase [Massilia endophytica]
MLGRLLALPFGSIWKLKTLCIGTKNPLLKKLYTSVYALYQYENNSSLAWNSSFESEPCFPHGIKSIFVSGDARIGSGCVIFQQVTIGSNMLPDSKGLGAPEIGRNCYIGAGAKIVGKVKVGDNVRIGANAVVFRDVPDNSVVVAGSSEIIRKDRAPDNRFYRKAGGWECWEEAAWRPVTDEAVLAKLKSVELR